MSVEVREMIPELPASKVDIHIHVSAQLNITPFVARQKVGGVVLSQVGTGVALPGLGRLGELGQIDVDAQTGQVLADQALIKQLIENAEQLAPDTTS
jgi:hypothetical protein